MSKTVSKSKQDAKFKHIKLSPIKQVKVDALQSNVLNRYFSEEKPEDVSMMRQDVQKRGILTALVAKKDGTLLAGHRRLMVAKSLNIKTVPVQYVEQKLSIEEETLFVIGDNVFRRQLSQKDRMMLYRHICPEIDEVIMMRTTEPQTFIKQELAVTKIARALGSTESNVRRDLGQAKLNYNKEHREKIVPVTNTPLVGEFKKLFHSLLLNSTGESKETKHEIVKLIEDYCVFLKNVDKFTTAQLINFSGENGKTKRREILAKEKSLKKI